MRTIPRTQPIPAGVIEAFAQPGDLLLLIETPGDYQIAPADVRALVDARPAQNAASAAIVTQEIADVDAARTYAKLTSLRNMTPAQVRSWVDANVTNLATATDAIKTLAVAVSILARRL